MLQDVLRFAFAPGFAVLETCWITVDAPLEYGVAAYVSTWLYTNTTRLLWFTTGRWFGFADTDHYHLFVDWQPWRLPYNRLWLPLVYWAEEIMMRLAPRAMARIAGDLETMAALYRPGDILFGRLRIRGVPVSQPVGGEGGRHLAMIAGSGGGKTTLLITMLSKHPGTAFIIDPKGQITRALAKRLGKGGRGIVGKGQKFCAFDPFGLVKDVLESASWNPLDEIERAVARLGQAADILYSKKVAEFLIIHQGEANLYWTNNARIILTGVILWVFHGEPPSRRHLLRVYELLTVGLEDPDRPIDKKTGRRANPMQWLFHQMSRCEAYRPGVNQAIKAAAAQYVDAGEKGRGIMMAAIREQMSYLVLEEVQERVQSSSFSLEELHAGTLNLSLVGRTTDIRETIPGLFRLFTGLSLYTFESINVSLKHPCLFAIDEMPSLGYIQAIADAAPIMRSYGVRLLAISQDIEKLEKAYPKDWGGFLGNAEAVYWMSTNHAQTLRYLEKDLGERTTFRTIQGSLLGKQQEQTSDEPLVRMQQIKQYLNARGGRLIVTRNGARPLFLKNEPYFKALPVYHYDRDPHHGDTMFRAATRLLCRALIAGPEPVVEQKQQ